MNLQTDTAAMPSKATLIKRARDMYPALRERAEQCVADRRVPDESIKEMEAAGFFETTKPREFGGYEMPYHDFCEIVMEVARGCPSSGWVLAVLGEHNQTLAAYFPMEVLEDVWGKSPATRIASGNSPALELTPTKGGWLVNGQLKFSSACHHAQRHVTMAMIDGKPMKITFPRGDAEIIETWHVMGLEGTGSNDIKLVDVFLPEHCAVPAGYLGPKSKDAPIYRQPQWSTNPHSLASAVVGAAQGGLDIYTNMVRERTPRMGGGFKLGELQSIQLRIAESAAEIDSARRALLSNLRETHDILLESDTVPVETMARNRRDMAYAAILCKRAIDRVFYASGAQALYLSHDMQRFFRDVNAGAQQVFLDWDIHATTFGQVTLGVDPGPVRW